jgi:pyrroline-5-carboxylate reductase
VNKPALAFIGGGNMATSLVGGLLEQGYPASNITVSDPMPENRSKLEQQFGITTSDDNHHTALNADIIVLAVKPQVMKQVSQALSSVLDHRPLVISIAAGIPLSSLQQWLGEGVPIVRCMPNTPALVQTGASGLFANSHVNAEQKLSASEILGAVGIACWLENEAEIDAVTALSGSGPAYFFLIMEVMEQVGIELGLSQTVAHQLTLQTALGAAKMASASDVGPAELRKRVTSPGGTTQSAIETFVASDITGLFRNAMGSAVKRAEEMAKEMSD